MTKEEFNILLTVTAEFDIGGVHDIQWSPECFDSLVLPDGYKDLVLAHVENQLNGEESFDDVINGKGSFILFTN